MGRSLPTASDALGSQPAASADPAPGPRRARSRVLPTGLAVTLVLAVVGACFLPTLSGSFVNFDDDVAIVAQAEHLGFAPAQLRWMLTSFHMGHYQPLSWMSLALDHVLWGLDPFGFRLTNLALHLLATALVFALSRELLAALRRVPGAGGRVRDRATSGGAEPETRAGHSRAPLLAAAGAALVFGLHPLRAEPVAWISQRHTLLATVLLLLAARSWLESAVDECGLRRRGFARYVGLLLASLLCTTWAATLPLVLLVLAALLLRRWARAAGDRLRLRRRGLQLESLVAAVPALAALVVAAVAQHASGATRSWAQHGLLARALQAAHGLVFHPAATLWPVDLGPLYPLDAQLDASEPRWTLSLLAVLAITAACWAWRRRAPALLAAWLSYALLVSPVLGFWQSGPQLTADRYGYVPSIAFALLAGGALCRGWERVAARRGERTATGLACGALLAWVAVFAPLTTAQVGVWHDSLSLWTHQLGVVPDHHIVRYDLGRALFAAGQLEQALEQLRWVRDHPPPDREGRLAVALDTAAVLAELGRLDEAEPIWREMLDLEPGHVAASVALGLAAAQGGRQDEAERWWRSALDGWQLAGRPDRDRALAARAAALLAEGSPGKRGPIGRP